jgi:hypothetical protein
MNSLYQPTGETVNGRHTMTAESDELVQKLFIDGINATPQNGTD